MFSKQLCTRGKFAGRVVAYSSIDFLTASSFGRCLCLLSVRAVI